MTNYQMLIDGKWVGGDKTMEVLNPANEQVLATVPAASAEDAQRALEAAAKAQRGWCRLTGVERGDVLRRWADLVDKHKARLAEILCGGRIAWTLMFLSELHVRRTDGLM